MRSRLGGLGCGELSPYDCWAYAQTYLRGRTLLILARYNTFYVLYPIGITSECTLIYQALGPAASIDPLFRYFLIAVLVIYVPGMFITVVAMQSCEILFLTSASTGSYVLYTHMIAQRRRVLRGKKRAD